MTQEELYATLKSTGMEVLYGHFTGPHVLPYICYRFVSDYPLAADDTAYARSSRWNVELYEAVKDAGAEASVEDALDRVGIWRKFEHEIPEDKCLQIVYEIKETSR